VYLWKKDLIRTGRGHSNKNNEAKYICDSEMKQFDWIRAQRDHSNRKNEEKCICDTEMKQQLFHNCSFFICVLVENDWIRTGRDHNNRKHEVKCICDTEMKQLGSSFATVVILYFLLCL